MRRRTGDAIPPRALLVTPAEPADGDLAVWAADFEAWRSARAAWVAAGGVWPGGEDQREFEEAIAVPDEPYQAADL